MNKILLSLSLVLGFGLMLASPVWADFQAGLDAYERGDYETALAEFRALADQGDASAQYNLGVGYDRGQGVPQDYQEAVKWYRRAADQGDASAQSNLGVGYDRGQGVPQDYQEAAKWYRRAAEQGEARAQYTLARMYYFGQGIPQDYVFAHMWANLAASQGGEDAVEKRDAIAMKMTPQQIAEAQRLAREWKAKGK